MNDESKRETSHLENGSGVAENRSDSDMPKTHWISPAFIGTYSAMGLTFMGTLGGFALFAPLKTDINNDLGPSSNIEYAPLLNVILSAISIQIVGRMSDVFGRRWFFITGTGIGLLASILGATAHSITQIIVSQALFGISLGIGDSFFWVVSEIVPMKWRYLAVSGQYIYTFPGNPLAAKVAVAFQAQTNTHWRGCFYFLIAVNTTAILLWYFFYHPTTFESLHRGTRVKDLLRHFDWIGLFLYSAALVVFLLGLTWGGGTYAWNSPQALACLICGAALFLLFAVWEIYLPFQATEPFLPLYLFGSIKFQSCVWLGAIGGAAYYGFSLVWPDAVRTLYTDFSTDKQGTLSSVAILCFTLGQMISGPIATCLGSKGAAISASIIAAPMLVAAGTDPLNSQLTLGFVATGCLFIGVLEGVSLIASTFPLKTQAEIGTAGGLVGTTRQFLGSVATAVFTTVLRNREGTTIPRYVYPSVIEAGLPQSSIPQLISGLRGATPLNNEAVPGYNTTIADIADRSWKTAHAQSYKTVFYVSFGFFASALVLSWFVPTFDRDKEDFVAGQVQRGTEEVPHDSKE